MDEPQEEKSHFASLNAEAERVPVSSPFHNRPWGKKKFCPWKPFLLFLKVECRGPWLTKIIKTPCAPILLQCIYNTQAMEATKVVINRQVDKKALLYIVTGILLGH